MLSLTLAGHVDNRWMLGGVRVVGEEGARAGAALTGISGAGGGTVLIGQNEWL